MKINAKNLGLAGGIVWGIILCGWTALSLLTGYAQPVLEGIGLVYPGYGVHGLGILLGLIYGFADGFASLWLVATVYNLFEK